MDKELHPRRLEILHYVARRRSDGNTAPSVKEIARAVGLSSTQTVHHHLQKLRGEGFVERDASWAKALWLTERGWEAVERMPLMGKISSGPGLEPTFDNFDDFDVQWQFLFRELRGRGGGEQRHPLWMVGDSMVGANIHDRDFVVVEEEEDPPDGTIVVVLLADDDVRIRRLYRKDTRVLLVAESPDHEDIEVEWSEVSVHSRVVYVIHAAP